MPEHMICLPSEVVGYIIDGKTTALPFALHPQPATEERMSEEQMAQMIAEKRRPPYAQGSLLYVYEPFAYCVKKETGECGVVYQADAKIRYLPHAETEKITRGTSVYNASKEGFHRNVKWINARHMPKWALRLILTVKQVGVERAASFPTIWELVGMNPKYPLENNPWAWRVGFVATILE